METWWEGFDHRVDAWSHPWWKHCKLKFGDELWEYIHRGVLTFELWIGLTYCNTKYAVFPFCFQNLHNCITLIAVWRNRLCAPNEMIHHLMRSERKSWTFSSFVSPVFSVTLQCIRDVLLWLYNHLNWIIKIFANQSIAWLFFFIRTLRTYNRKLVETRLATI